jgi:hypothetical protein
VHRDAEHVITPLAPRAQHPSRRRPVTPSRRAPRGTCPLRTSAPADRPGAHVESASSAQ